VCITVVDALRTAALDPQQQLELGRRQLPPVPVKRLLVASANRMRLASLVSSETRYLLRPQPCGRASTVHSVVLRTTSAAGSCARVARESDTNNGRGTARGVCTTGRRSPKRYQWRVGAALARTARFSGIPPCQDECDSVASLRSDAFITLGSPTGSGDPPCRTPSILRREQPRSCSHGSRSTR
jgi:hypothetical protein